MKRGLADLLARGKPRVPPSYNCPVEITDDSQSSYDSIQVSDTGQNEAEPEQHKPARFSLACRRSALGRYFESSQDDQEQEQEQPEVTKSCVVASTPIAPDHRAARAGISPIALPSTLKGKKALKSKLFLPSENENAAELQNDKSFERAYKQMTYADVIIQTDDVSPPPPSHDNNNISTRNVSIMANRLQESNQVPDHKNVTLRKSQLRVSNQRVSQKNEAATNTTRLSGIERLGHSNPHTNIVPDIVTSFNEVFEVSNRALQKYNEENARRKKEALAMSILQSTKPAQKKILRATTYIDNEDWAIDSGSVEMQDNDIKSVCSQKSIKGAEPVNKTHGSKDKKKKKEVQKQKEGRSRSVNRKNRLVTGSRNRSGSSKTRHAGSRHRSASSRKRKGSSKKRTDNPTHKPVAQTLFEDKEGQDVPSLSAPEISDVGNKVSANKSVERKKKDVAGVSAREISSDAGRKVSPKKSLEPKKKDTHSTSIRRPPRLSLRELIESIDRDTHSTSIRRRSNVIPTKLVETNEKVSESIDGAGITSNQKISELYDDSEGWKTDTGLSSKQETFIAAVNILDRLCEGQPERDFPTADCLVETPDALRKLSPTKGKRHQKVDKKDISTRIAIPTVPKVPKKNDKKENKKKDKSKIEAPQITEVEVHEMPGKKDTHTLGKINKSSTDAPQITDVVVHVIPAKKRTNTTRKIEKSNIDTQITTEVVIHKEPTKTNRQSEIIETLSKSPKKSASHAAVESWLNTLCDPVDAEPVTEFVHDVIEPVYDLIEPVDAILEPVIMVEQEIKKPGRKQAVRKQPVRSRKQKHPEDENQDKKRDKDNEEEILTSALPEIGELVPNASTRSTRRNQKPSNETGDRRRSPVKRAVKNTVKAIEDKKAKATSQTNTDCVQQIIDDFSDDTSESRIPDQPEIVEVPATSQKKEAKSKKEKTDKKSPRKPAARSRPRNQKKSCDPNESSKTASHHTASRKRRTHIDKRKELEELFQFFNPATPTITTSRSGRVTKRRDTSMMKSNQTTKRKTYRKTSRTDLKNHKMNDDNGNILLENRTNSPETHIPEPDVPNAAAPDDLNPIESDDLNAIESDELNPIESIITNLAVPGTSKSESTKDCESTLKDIVFKKPTMPLPSSKVSTRSTTRLMTRSQASSSSSMEVGNPPLSTTDSTISTPTPPSGQPTAKELPIDNTTKKRARKKKNVAGGDHRMLRSPQDSGISTATEYTDTASIQTPLREEVESNTPSKPFMHSVLNKTISRRSSVSKQFSTIWNKVVLPAGKNEMQTITWGSDQPQFDKDKPISTDTTLKWVRNIRVQQISIRNGTMKPVCTACSNVLFIIIRGEAEVFMHNRTHTFSQGDQFGIPKTVEYQIKNVGSADLLMCFIMCDAIM